MNTTNTAATALFAAIAILAVAAAVGVTYLAIVEVELSTGVAVVAVLAVIALCALLVLRRGPVLRLSTLIAFFVLLGTLLYVFVDFVTRPWVAVGIWGALIVVGVVTSVANTIRERRFQFVFEFAVQAVCAWPFLSLLERASH